MAKHKKPNKSLKRTSFSRWQLAAFALVFAAIGGLLIYRSFAAGPLPWAPPTLTNPITINVSNSNRSFNLNPGQDYIIKMPSTPLTARGGLTLKGGRNIVIIGGEIRIDQLHAPGEGIDLQYGIYSLGHTGTLHIEGMWIHGNGLGQGIALAPIWETGQVTGTVQIQNTRIETLHPVGDVHTDGIQAMAGPKVVRLYNLTIRSQGLSLQMSPYQSYSGALGQWHYENIDMHHLSKDAPALARQGGNPWWAEYHKEFWLNPHPQHGNPIMCNWTNSSLCWNPGNGSNVTGENIKIGLRPSGEFVPAGGTSSGIGYVSPGYTGGGPPPPPPTDTSPPSIPQGLRHIGSAQTSISIAWNASTDNVGVAGYRLWRNSTQVATSTNLSYTFTGLICGTAYTNLGVQAYDAAGNASHLPSATFASLSTSACSSTDTSPPSVPQGLRVTSRTQTSISIAWNAATDNIGVTGYRLSNNGTQVATTTSLNYTFTGLTCGTTYSGLGLQAYDAAGNLSSLPHAIVGPTATNACGSTVPPHIAAADLNNDGIVNILDLSILLAHYNTTNPAADINGDGQVNVTDLSLLLNRYQ